MDAAARLVVVANPAAGNGKAGRLIGKVDAHLHALRVAHEIRVSESATDLERLARTAAEEGAEIVAVLGGDGSVNSAANGLLGTEAALAVLPAGTGDDFAKAIGSGKLGAATKRLVDPTIREIDVVRVVAGATERHFVNVAGAGFDSEVNETANAMTVKLGSAGTYVVAVLTTLRRFTAARYEITVDAETLALSAMLAIVGNGVSYGGGMKVLPTASITDGLLDVCIVEELSRPAFLRAFPRVFRGTHVTHPKVHMLRGRTVKMEADRRIHVYADGERVGPLPAIFEIEPGALRAVVDPEARTVM
ncbi:MAG TPA: diacylglycerol kinase family protein [Actinomycetota bacterium]|jgi:diacylglycerol kinase (ATP)|nr:diacylglycerol kinase family protein [Actinomycetota bacterium]